MDWNGSIRPFVSRPAADNSFSFVYNYNYDQYPAVLEMKQSMQPAHAISPSSLDKNNYGMNQEKKKRLSTDQLESLENSFQEEIKLDPDRKMKLAKELGLQPRQIAVWFQNRRARWKAKQLENLYDSLKREFDAVSREKQKLQEEVLALRAVLKEQATKKQVSTDISGEETVESTSIPSSSNTNNNNNHNNNNNKPQFTSAGRQSGHQGNNYGFNVDDYTPVMTPYWTDLPSYP